MPTLKIKNFAQIKNATIEFGDLTVFVGPQASGKSLVLQLLKFALDRTVIAAELKNNGLDWDQTSRHGLLATFLGEGYEHAFSPDTQISYDGKTLLNEKQRSSKRDASVFFIPAQRVMTIAKGWPRPFSDFEAGDPFVVRQFSQNVLEQFNRGIGRNGTPIFPQPDRLKAAIRRSIERSIFHGGELLLKAEGGRKRLIIRYPGNVDGTFVELPFLEWSAGQREFAPLLLGLYQLLPSGAISAHKAYKWAVIEEPEMGLHPMAINSVMLLAFELMHRGYRVCLATHSPYVLELVWAIRMLQESNAPNRATAVLEALALEGTALREMAESLLTKSIRTWALTFDQQFQHQCTDISALDIDSLDPVLAGWGGVTSLSAIVSRAVAKGL